MVERLGAGCCSHLQKQRTMEAAAARQKDLKGQQQEQQQVEQPGLATVAQVEMGGSSLLPGQWLVRQGCTW